MKSSILSGLLALTVPLFSAPPGPILQPTQKYIALFEPRLTETCEHGDKILQSSVLLNYDRHRTLKKAGYELDHLNRTANIAQALRDRIERHRLDPAKSTEKWAQTELEKNLMEIASSIGEFYSLVSNTSFPFDKLEEAKIREDILLKCRNADLVAPSLAAKNQEPNQQPQRNAGSHPDSDDSPAHETPSSLGPRG